MNGVTGRMGTNQHLIRSILAIAEEGGIPIGDGEVIMPDPFLVGRNPAKLEKLSETTGVEKWSTDLTAALADDAYSVYFDAQVTSRRVDAVEAAISAGKHIYCEKRLLRRLPMPTVFMNRQRRQDLKMGSFRINSGYPVSETETPDRCRLFWKNYRCPR